MNLSRSTKAPDSETDAPKFTKTLSFTNGNRFLQPSQQQQQQPMMVVYYYKECLKNHAASIGGYSLDGCGEFMPAPNANPSDPSSLKCAACGCHRNFHRREPDDNLTTTTTTTTTTHFLNFHQRLPMSSSSPSLSPKSPQPVQQAYYTAAAPHMLLALGSGGSGGVPDQQHQEGKRKRFRTKFSREQKERMCVLADKLGWKMQKSEEKLVEEFCKDVGVPRRVFKVWMHNNKNLVKRANYHVAAAHDDDSININVDGDCKREDSEANVGGGDNDNAVHAGSSSSSYERN